MSSSDACGKLMVSDPILSNSVRIGLVHLTGSLCLLFVLGKINRYAQICEARRFEFQEKTPTTLFSKVGTLLLRSRFIRRWLLGSLLLFRRRLICLHSLSFRWNLCLMLGRLFTSLRLFGLIAFSTFGCLPLHGCGLMLSCLIPSQLQLTRGSLFVITDSN